MLGSLYSVLFRRRSTILGENVIEGTSLFLLSTHLPVVESFGFSMELLKKTSGKGTSNSGKDLETSTAQPQLSYSHWSLISDDPFWRPTTADELEMFGDSVSISVSENSSGGNNSLHPLECGDNLRDASHNIARRIIDSVRRRKGLPIETKIVVAADKQRTFRKNK